MTKLFLLALGLSASAAVGMDDREERISDGKVGPLVHQYDFQDYPSHLSRKDRCKPKIHHFKTTQGNFNFWDIPSCNGKRKFWEKILDMMKKMMKKKIFNQGWVTFSPFNGKNSLIELHINYTLIPDDLLTLLKKDFGSLKKLSWKPSSNSQNSQALISGLKVLRQQQSLRELHLEQDNGGDGVVFLFLGTKKRWPGLKRLSLGLESLTPIPFSFFEEKCPNLKDLFLEVEFPQKADDFSVWLSKLELPKSLETFKVDADIHWQKGNDPLGSRGINRIRYAQVQEQEDFKALISGVCCFVDDKILKFKDFLSTYLSLNREEDLLRELLKDETLLDKAFEEWKKEVFKECEKEALKEDFTALFSESMMIKNPKPNLLDSLTLAVDPVIQQQEGFKALISDVYCFVDDKILKFKDFLSTYLSLNREKDLLSELLKDETLLDKAFEEWKKEVFEKWKEDFVKSSIEFLSSYESEKIERIKRDLSDFLKKKKDPWLDLPDFLKTHLEGETGLKGDLKSLYKEDPLLTAAILKHVFSDIVKKGTGDKGLINQRIKELFKVHPQLFKTIRGGVEQFMEKLDLEGILKKSPNLNITLKNSNLWEGEKQRFFEEFGDRVTFESLA